MFYSLLENELGDCENHQRNTTNNIHTPENRKVLLRSKLTQSTVSICSDGDIEYSSPTTAVSTSPNSTPVSLKHSNLNDSLEFSSRVSYASPSQQFLSSQTWAIESPEVGWKWNPQADASQNGTRILRSRRLLENSRVRNSSNSSNNSTTMSMDIVQMNAVSNRQQSHNSIQSLSVHSSNSFRREKHRRKLELELRRKEEARTEQTLKQRCAKLKEHLNSARTPSSNNNNVIGNNENTISINRNVINNNDESTMCEMEHEVAHLMDTPPLKSTIEKIEDGLSQLKANDDSNNSLIGDFFNDSMTDDILLAATQEIELKLQSSQEVVVESNARIEKETRNSEIDCHTPTSSRKKGESRPSFYMKFLEDDCPEDWFASLDEAVLKATQVNVRSPFQRYKSMPVDTRRKSPTESSFLEEHSNSRTDKTAMNSRLTEMNSLNGDKAPDVDGWTIKRHVSIHTLSPPTTSSKMLRRTRNIEKK